MGENMGENRPACCTEESICPQHLQQAQEDKKWAEAAMMQRREAGNTKFYSRTLGVLA